MKEKEILDIINKEEWVDLGLPSGTLWCNHNMGTTSPLEDGDYKPFDEVPPVLIESNPRVPNAHEILELTQHTDYQWICSDEFCGGLFKSKTNGNSIFIPASGYINKGDSIRFFGRRGRLWSGEECSEHPINANALWFSSKGSELGDGGKSCKFTIRLVK